MRAHHLFAAYFLCLLAQVPTIRAQVEPTYVPPTYLTPGKIIQRPGYGITPVIGVPNNFMFTYNGVVLPVQGFDSTVSLVVPTEWGYLVIPKPPQTLADGSILKSATYDVAAGIDDRKLVCTYELVGKPEPPPVYPDQIAQVSKIVGSTQYIQTVTSTKPEAPKFAGLVPDNGEKQNNGTWLFTYSKDNPATTEDKRTQGAKTCGNDKRLRFMAKRENLR